MSSLLRADARRLPLRDGCVQCVVTSPPYFGLRDYGIAGQIGLEQTPDAYVAELVAVFREVRRVLREDGVAFVVLGDSYAGSWGAQSREHAGKHAPNVSALSANQVKAAAIRSNGTGSLARTPGLKPKDLSGIPWRVAFALQADGWWLRQDIIWHKPNPMPESVTDRCTKAHEYVFLLTKAARYYWDTEAIADEASGRSCGNKPGGKSGSPRDGLEIRNFAAVGNKEYHSRNARSVWTIATQPYPEAHFATFPEELAERCVKAGSRPGDLVLDPFGGSGTVAQVACRLNRRAVCTELNPAYVALAQRRISEVQVSLLEATG